jgi:hypothetical protein
MVYIDFVGFSTQPDSGRFGLVTVVCRAQNTASHIPLAIHVMLLAYKL